MTRTDFIAEMTEISELIDFCHREDYHDLVEEIYDEDQFDEYMYNEMRSAESWRNFVDYANSLPDFDYSYYKIDMWGEVEGLDEDDFNWLFAEIFNKLEEDDFFEDEELEDDEEEAELIAPDFWNETIDRTPEEEEEFEDELFDILKLA